jgi:hypothetical protein
LDPAITRILNFWGEMLNEAGVTSYSVRPEPNPVGYRYLTRGEANTRLDLEVLRGLDFHQTMHLLRFDNELGRAVPIDLTGADLRFRIYKPPAHILNITMSHPEHGQVTASIPLTAEENRELHHIERQSDHDVFMERIIAAHRLEIEQELSKQLARDD